MVVLLEPSEQMTDITIPPEAVEAAVKVCDEYSASEMKFFNAEGGLAALGRANAAEDLAAAIRALGSEATVVKEPRDDA